MLRVFVLSLLLAVSARADPKPGIVFITVDGMGWGDLSSSGNVQVPTPRIDALLNQSAVFRQFHVSPLDAPSRAALLTGMHPIRAGVWGSHSGRHRLGSGLLTVARLLRSAGWETGLFGTWALGDAPPARPEDHGYAEVLTHPGGTPGGVADFYSNDGTDDFWLSNGAIMALAGSHLEACFGAAMRFIEKHRDRPYFCHLSPSLPAGMAEAAVLTFRVRPEVQNPRRAAWLAELDRAVGRLVDHLDRLNLTATTLLILTSTTGAHRPGHGGELQTFNAGRRGFRGSPYEGGHCVPLSIRWPEGGVLAGNVQTPAAHFDILPTIAAFAAVPLPTEVKSDGISLAPFITESPPPNPPAGRVLIADAQEIPVPIQWRQNCIMDGPWRLINGRELYDLRTDPGQRKNIAAGNREAVERLRAAGDAWWRDLSPERLEPVRILVGGPQDPVLLTPHDWLARGTAPLTRDDVIRGVPAAAPWLLHVVTDSAYDILLRRWPLTVDRALSDSFFVVEKARIRMGTHDESRPVAPTATGVNFRVTLKPGPVALQTWFTGGGKNSSAYFVEIRRAIEVRSAKPVPQSP
jgi:arylsulfatase A-like enzyme